MTYDEGLAQRVRERLAGRRDVEEKQMFGGIAFLLAGNMCCGVVKDNLMVRVGAEHYADSLQRQHAREMDFTGKPLKGFVYVAPEGIAEDADLHAWLERGIAYAATLPAK